MAILALANNVEDMKKRLGNMVVGFSKTGEPLTADDFVSLVFSVFLTDHTLEKIDFSKMYTLFNRG